MVGGLIGYRRGEMKAVDFCLCVWNGDQGWDGANVHIGGKQHPVQSRRRRTRTVLRRMRHLALHRVGVRLIVTAHE